MAHVETVTQLDTEKEASTLTSARKLVVFDRTGVRRIRLPSSGELSIGRGSDADVRIDHPRVSRLHALLSISERICIEDLGSVNGTHLGGSRLSPRAPTEMVRGVAVTLGDTLLLVEGDSAPATVACSSELDAVTKRIARSNISVVLQGETGAGKEVLAEKIHAASRRANAPLVKLNCAALPESLLESELFGYERGAFTGAIRSKPGLLEWGDGGSIFLDEIGELPLATQAKLLRVLESRELLRLGSVRAKRIDVRFICATHRDLVQLVGKGAFREDLYFRLNGMTLTVPALRERQDEILPLARRFAREAAERMGESAPPLSPAVEQKLLRHGWPGNVRELKNAMDRAVVLANGCPLLPEHLALDDRRTSSPPARRPPSGSVDIRDEVMALERQRIIEALERAGGNQTEAARSLNMPRRTLISRLDQYSIARPRKRLN
jgi:two-component system, NtrC family, response regulator AtoC